MSILKQKIAQALLRRQQLEETLKAKTVSFMENSPSFHSYNESPSEALSEQTQTSRRGRRKSAVGNNIMKNYCRALVNFGLSTMAEPYMKGEDDQPTLSDETFRAILNSKKKKVNCIKTLRALLLHDGRDSKEMKIFKPVFQSVCLAFLKFFCANWIFNSKVADKMKHLKYRGKMLRRVQNPQFFTYLEDITKSEKNNSCTYIN